MNKFYSIMAEAAKTYVDIQDSESEVNEDYPNLMLMRRFMKLLHNVTSPQDHASIVSAIDDAMFTCKGSTVEKFQFLWDIANEAAIEWFTAKSLSEYYTTLDA